MLTQCNSQAIILIFIPLCVDVYIFAIFSLQLLYL